MRVPRATPRPRNGPLPRPPLPITYRIYPERRAALVTLSGDVTLDEIVRGIEQVDSDPAFSQSFSILVDGRRAGRLPVRGEMLEVARRIARNARPEATGARRAVLVASAVAYGVGRAFELLIVGARPVYRVFRDPEAACDWLGWPAELVAERRGSHRLPIDPHAAERYREMLAEISERLARVRGSMTDEEFDALVREAARVRVKYE